MESISNAIDGIIGGGECVYALCWDSGTPLGGTSCERVYLLDESYYVFLDDGEYLESYQTLQEAIAATEQLYRVGPATTEIQSTELSIDQIISLLEPFDGLDRSELRIKINGETRIVSSR